MKITAKQLKQIIREEVERSNLEEKVAMDSVAGKIRQTVNTCSQYISDQLQFVKSKRPNWQGVMVALQDAENALEEAHAEILKQLKSGN